MSGREMSSSSRSATFSFGSSNDELVKKLKEMMELTDDDDDDDNGSSAALSSLFLGQLCDDHMGTAATVTRRVCTTRVVHAGQTVKSIKTTTIEHLGQQPRDSVGRASASVTGHSTNSTAASPRPRSATTSSARAAGNSTRPASVTPAKVQTEHTGAAGHVARKAAAYAAATHVRPTASSTKTARPSSAHAIPHPKNGEVAPKGPPKITAPKDKPTLAAGPAAPPAAREEIASGLDRRDASVAQKLAKADAYASKAPSAAEETVKGLALYLASVGDCDITQARCIYRWITMNVAYDTKGFFSGHYSDCSASGVLRSRQGVCSGYANLFKALAEAVGLAVETVNGYAKGYGYDPSEAAEQGEDHAWNVVRLAGEWRLVDACWGAGHVNGTEFERKFDDFYFATRPSDFITNHLPGKESWQLLVTPLTKKEYLSLVNLKPAFHELGLSEVCLKPRSGCLQSKTGHFKAHISQVPAGVEFSIKVVDKAQNTYLSRNHCKVESDGAGNHTFHAALPHPGHYDVEFFGAFGTCRRQGQLTLANICSYSVEAMSGCPTL